MIEVTFPLGVQIGFGLFVLLFIFGLIMGMVEKLKKKRIPKWRGVFGFGLVGILICGIAYAVIQGGSSDIDSKAVDKSRPKLPPIDAKIHVEGGNLVIKNLNNYTWNTWETWEGQAIEIEINGDFKYYYREPVRKGEEIKLSLMSFTDKKGLRLNPLIFKVKRIVIGCKEDTGTWGW